MATTERSIPSFEGNWPPWVCGSLKAQKHTKVYLNGKQTTLPRHGNQEIGEGLRRAILRQLGVKPKDR